MFAFVRLFGKKAKFYLFIFSNSKIKFTLSVVPGNFCGLLSPFVTRVYEGAELTHGGYNSYPHLKCYEQSIEKTMITKNE